MKSIINRFAIIFGAIIGVLMVLGFINQSEDGLPLNSSSNVVDIIGTWVHNDNAYNKEVKLLGKPMHNLSDAVGTIKMIISDDFTYKSYFDATIYNGLWKIENDSLYMKQGSRAWQAYDYKLDENELFIYDRLWLISLVRK